MINYKNILVPTDFSEGFDIALSHAEEIALMNNARLHIIHIIEPTAFPSDLSFSQVSFVNLEKELEKNALIEIQKIEENLKSKHIDCKTEISYGRASDQIINYSIENDIDLICISTHGRRGLDHLLFGSTTERVLKRAHCPVLAVRIPKQVDK
jgi:nucleotide-binding universal stress UspA family protein